MNINDATCPLCLAEPGQPCVTAGAPELAASHAERQHLARLGACPRCGAGVGEPCFQKKKGFLLLEHWSRMECLAVSCEYCGASAGDLCTSPGGIRGPHRCRVAEAEAVAAFGAR